MHQHSHFYHDEESAFHGGGDGLHSRYDFRVFNQQYPPHLRGFYNAPAAEYHGRFSFGHGGGARRISHHHHPPQFFPIPHSQQPSFHSQRNTSFDHAHFHPHYHAPILHNVGQPRLMKKKRSSKTPHDRRSRRPTTQFYPAAIAHPNFSQQYNAYYRNSFLPPTTSLSPIPNSGNTNINFVSYQVASPPPGTTENHLQHLPSSGGHNATVNPMTPVWYKNEEQLLPSTFASRFTRDNSQYQISDERSRGGHNSGIFSISTPVDEVDEEIDRNVQQISSDIDNYKNEIILRPPGSRAGLVVASPIIHIDTEIGRPLSGRSGGKNDRVRSPLSARGIENTNTNMPSSWTKQLATILRSKHERHTNLSNLKPANVKQYSSPRRAGQHQPQVIHKFLTDATFGIHKQIVETDDHAFNEFECNCQHCGQDANKSNNFGHSYYNLFDEKDNRNNDGAMQHDPNNNNVLQGDNRPHKEFDAENPPRLRYMTSDIVTAITNILPLREMICFA